MGLGHRVRAGQQPAVARYSQRRPSDRQTVVHFFLIILFYLFFGEVWGMGHAFWENGCIAPPFFEPCPYT
jgi:hypothetical protein